jgi:hypothetical protein
MSVDPLPFSATSGSGGGDDYDIAPTPNDVHDNLTRLEKKQLYAKNQKKVRMQASRFKTRKSGPDSKWECPVPTCQRKFNRNGLFDHL